MKTSQRRQRSGFTLIEILVVLSIIALLAALLFPAFSRARENGRQTNCASNLNQIYFAVQQYFQDERAYPDSLVDLLPEGAKFDNGAPGGGVIGTNAGGYLKSERVLSCQNDSTNSTQPRSSYGSLNKQVSGLYPYTATADPATYAWNYWGYDSKGFAFGSPSDVSVTNALTVEENSAFDPVSNPVKYSLANRYADPSTIITHCVFHRFQTGGSAATPDKLYSGAPTNYKYARDVVLRLDGSARVLDITNWYNTNQLSDLWQNQKN